MVSNNVIGMGMFDDIRLDYKGSNVINRGFYYQIWRHNGDIDSDNQPQKKQKTKKMRKNISEKLGGLRICRFDCILFQTFLFKLPITK
jgi:hypothetical protein